MPPPSSGVWLKNNNEAQVRDGDAKRIHVVVIPAQKPNGELVQVEREANQVGTLAGFSDRVFLARGRASLAKDYLALR